MHDFEPEKTGLERRSVDFVSQSSKTSRLALKLTLLFFLKVQGIGRDPAILELHLAQ